MDLVALRHLVLMLLQPVVHGLQVMSALEAVELVVTLTTVVALLMVVALALVMAAVALQTCLAVVELVMRTVLSTAKDNLLHLVAVEAYKVFKVTVALVNLARVELATAYLPIVSP